MSRLSRVLLAAAAACSLVAAGCGGDDEPALKSNDPPQDIVAYAIETLGAERAVLGPQDTRALIRESGTTQGYLRAELDCVLGAALPLLGGDAGIDKLTVAKASKFVTTARNAATTEQARAPIDACISQESSARRKAREVSPDFDVAAVKRVGLVAALANAIAVGLTDAEADCYVRKIDAVPVAELDKQVRGRGGDVPKAGTFITGCLSDRRIDRLAPELEQALFDRRAEREAERQRTAQSIQEEINRRSAPTVTPSTAAP